VCSSSAPLGYNALWLASSGAQVDTIEQDAEHARLAREIVAPKGADVRLLNEERCVTTILSNGLALSVLRPSHPAE
jgi:predicted O-methyltransferase YrrM